MNTKLESYKSTNSESTRNFQKLNDLYRFSVLPLAFRTFQSLVEESLANHNQAMIDNFSDPQYPEWRKVQDYESFKEQGGGDIIFLDSPLAKFYSREIGAKADNSRKMMEWSKNLSASVPLGFSLSVRAYKRFKENGNKLPEDLKIKLINAYEELCRKVCSERGIPFQYLPVAIRSSGVMQDDEGNFIEGAEDSVQNSFAGLNETLLNVVGPEAVVEATEYVLGKCENEASREYMTGKGLNPDHARMSVFIQEMVVPQNFLDVGGVINTISRVSGDELTVETIIGGCEYAVGNMAYCQVFTLDRKTFEITDRINKPQERCLIINPFTTSLADANLDIVLPKAMETRLEILRLGLELDKPENIQKIIEISQNKDKSNLLKKLEGYQLAQTLFESEVKEACFVKVKGVNNELLINLAKNLLLHSEELMILSREFYSVHDKVVLDEAEVVKWAKNAMSLEQESTYFSDIEYAHTDNGVNAAPSEKLLQIRPLTGLNGGIDDFGPERSCKILTSGINASAGVISGPVQFIYEDNMNDYKPGHIPIFPIADNIFTPVEIQAPGAIAISGTLNGHASNIAAELSKTDEKLTTGFPYIVAVDGAALKQLKDGDIITVDTWCKKPADAVIMLGEDTARLQSWREYLSKPFTRERGSLKRSDGSILKLGVISSDPGIAKNIVEEGYDSLTLQRMENMYLKTGIHPMKMIKEGRREELLNILFNDLKELVDTFSKENLTIAIRAMDFQGPDMKTLEGYDKYESQNILHSLMGDRGAYRLTVTMPEILDLEADLLLKLVKYRDSKGIKAQIKYFVPFVRDDEDVRRVFSTLEKKGIIDGQNGILLGIMAELASNRDIQNFVRIKSPITGNPYISFVSIGGNDGNQAWSSAHREFVELLKRYTTTSETFKEGYVRPIAETCFSLGIDLSFCGNQPSDNIEFAEFLYSLPGITEIGVKPGSLKSVTLNLNKVAEAARNKKLKFLTPFNLK